mgnify:FL=1
MYATGNKKMLNMLILEILEEYSDANHHLTQQEILRLLRLNYDMECDRRSVKANVLSLKELGYEISMEDGDGYYLVSRDFEDAELRMLIDSVLFSSNLTQTQAKNLIEKLKKQSNRYFSAKVSHVSNLPELHHGDNKQLMYVLDTINDAISEKKKISFVYNNYGTDFKLHARRSEPYIVNPYQMVANKGRYYLICNYDKYDDISHFRLDKITQVKILDEPVKPMKQVHGLEQGLNLTKHMAEHIYMFSGQSVRVKLRTDSDTVSELIDWFGKDFRITEESDGKILVSLLINEQAMFYWALQYGPYVEVLEPESLRSKLRDAVAKMNEKYERKNDRC